MTHPLPIALCLFTSTKGHFGHRDVYRTTLNHLDRQVPLNTFGARVAHIKVGSSVEEQAIATVMEADLEGYGFEVITTVADWSRGQSHQLAYMEDVVRVSKHPSVTRQPYMLWLEDDSTITPHECSAEDLLLRSCQMLADDNELTSVRLLRAGDLSTSPMVDEVGADARFFHSPHFNFQPALLRSRDFYLGARLVEANPEGAATIQCEMLWRMVLTIFSRSPRQHRVYHPSFAETIHLGTPDYPALKVSLNL